MSEKVSMNFNKNDVAIAVTIFYLCIALGMVGGLFVIAFAYRLAAQYWGKHKQKTKVESGSLQTINDFPDKEVSVAYFQNVLVMEEV
jgi:hypothetical protein